jgi:hypothetical protein
MHEAAQAEIASNLAAAPNREAKIEYLSELQREYIHNDLIQALADAGARRTKLRESNSTKAGIIPLNVRAVMVMQEICKIYSAQTARFTDPLRLEFGLLFLIATDADERLAHVKQEIDRQKHFLLLGGGSDEELNDEAVNDSANGNADADTEPGLEVAAFMSGKADPKELIALCDKAALKIGLTIRNAYTGKAAARRKIHALAKGLRDSYKAGGDEAAFKVALAKRYMVDYSSSYDPQHYPDRGKPNKIWAKEVVDVMQACR